MGEDDIIKELEWIASSRKGMKALPRPVRRVFGYALNAVQMGETPPRQSHLGALAAWAFWN